MEPQSETQHHSQFKRLLTLGSVSCTQSTIFRDSICGRKSSRCPQVMASASRAVCLVLVSLALLQCVQGQTTAQQIVQAITEITTLSSDLRTQVRDINVVNVLFQGPNVPQGLLAIEARVGAAISAIQGSPPPAEGFSDDDAQLIVNALTTFVEVHEALLNDVIGRQSLLALFSYAEPVRQALVQLEATVDAFALLLIAQIPTQTAAANVQFTALDATLNQAIQAYS